MDRRGILEPYIANVEEETLQNVNYRQVAHTGKYLQLVYMNLVVGEYIPAEIHTNADQFIRIEQGTAGVTINGEKSVLYKDDVIIIPAGSRHYVENAGDIELKLYTLYAMPQHRPGHRDLVQGEED